MLGAARSNPIGAATQVLLEEMRRSGRFGGDEGLLGGPATKRWETWVTLPAWMDGSTSPTWKALKALQALEPDGPQAEEIWRKLQMSGIAPMQEIPGIELLLLANQSQRIDLDPPASLIELALMAMATELETEFTALRHAAKLTKAVKGQDQKAEQQLLRRNRPMLQEGEAQAAAEADISKSIRAALTWDLMWSCHLGLPLPSPQAVSRARQAIAPQSWRWRDLEGKWSKGTRKIQRWLEIAGAGRCSRGTAEQIIEKLSAKPQAIYYEERRGETTRGCANRSWNEQDGCWCLRVNGTKTDRSGKRWSMWQLEMKDMPAGELGPEAQNTSR